MTLGDSEFLHPCEEILYSYTSSSADTDVADQGVLLKVLHGHVLHLVQVLEAHEQVSQSSSTQQQQQ